MNSIDIIKKRLAEEQPYTLATIDYLIDSLSLFFPEEDIYELSTSLINLLTIAGGRMSYYDIDEFIKLCKPKRE